MEKMIYEQQTEIYDIRYCAVVLVKLLTNYNLHICTEMYKNYTDQNITSFTHKCTNE